MHDNIPRGADLYWESAVDTTDRRDDPPPDDHEITDEQAEAWAREIGEASDEQGAVDALLEIYGVPV